MLIEIYRGAAVIASFKATQDTVFTHQLMGEHKIIARFQAIAPLDIRIGDFIDYGGELFTINAAPQVVRLADQLLEYTIEFEGEIYRLYNKIFMDEGAAEFSYYGTPSDYLSLLLTNINEIDPGWTLGVIYDAVEPKHLTFTNESCREALTRIAELFGLEYSVAGRAISMVQKVGVDTLLTLEYGKGKGLYNLTRISLNDKNVVTRLFAFGSEKNIDFDYRGGRRRLVFNALKLESNIALYGTIEHSIIFDDIYPNRTGSVTAINVGNVFEITDGAIDFDINDYLLEGVVAKIVFKTGDLGGNEFEIVSYDHATKKITFKELVEENDYRLPNDVVKPAIGDEYTLVDIKMPQAYIDTAEAALQAKAQAFLDEHDHPTVTYAFSCDEKFVIDSALDLKIGDRVQVVDVGLGIDITLRISEISYPLLFPGRVTAAITEGLAYTTEERIIRVTAESRKQIREVNRSSQELARLNTLRMQELQDLVFDPDGYFDTENIRPSSIETIHLAVGTKSQQFALSGIVFSPNLLGDVSKFGWTAGTLAHYTIEETIRSWNITGGTYNGLINGDAPYIYARCPVVGASATIVLTTEQRKVEHEAGFYHFLIGVLHSVVDGVRGISLTYGTTEINGKFIRTGTITSQDGLTWFNLDTGEISGKITFAAGSSGYQNLTDLPGSNPHFEMDKKLWSTSYNGFSVPESTEGTIVSEGSWGGKALQIGSNIYNQRWWKNAIPIDTTRVYKGRFRVRQTVDPTVTPSSNVYAGAACLDKNYNRLGGNNIYFIVAQTTVLTSEGWRIFEGTITGAQFPAGTVYVRPMFIVNYNPATFGRGDGTAQIDGLEFFDITDAYNAEQDAAAAQAAADAAQADADLAAASATTANNLLIDIASDSKFTPGEKQAVKKEWDAIVGEKPKIDAEADEFGVSKTAYGTAYSNLSGYLTGIWGFAADLTTTSTIDGPTFRLKFKTYYDARQDILNAITTAAKALADAAQLDVDNLTASLGDMAYEDLVELAKLGTTVIEGGYIKTTLIDTAALIVSGDLETEAGAQSKVDALAALLGNAAYEDLIGLALLDSTVIVGGYIKTSLIDTAALIVSGDLETEAGAQSKVDALAALLGNAAYEDLIGLALLDSTVIVGGYIKTSLIDVDTLVAKNVLTAASGKRVHIDGANNRMVFYNASGIELLRLDENVGTDVDGNNISGLVAKNSGNTRQAYLTSAGVYSTGSAVAFDTSGGTNASILGILKDRGSFVSDISAAVVGLDETTTGASLKYYGGYFNSLWAGSLHLATINISGATYNIAANTKVTYYIATQNGMTVNLPASPRLHQVFYIRPEVAGITISGNGNDIIAGSHTTYASLSLSSAHTRFFIWNGVQWYSSLIAN